MRFPASFLLAFFAGTLICPSQTIDVKSSKKSELPSYRPALIGTGPAALINLIDSQALLKEGQKDTAVMFACTVKTTGNVVWSSSYRSTSNSTLLEIELHKKLRQARFIPAVYNHVPVDAIYYGTVIFAVVEGKPRLRIFSNQETEELKKESDFVGPQPVFGGGGHFMGWAYPSKEECPLEIGGAVELNLEVGEDGIVKNVGIGKEEPPFVGFGFAAEGAFRAARYIPAFRDGKPVACKVTLPVYFRFRGEVFDGTAAAPE